MLSEFDFRYKNRTALDIDARQRTVNASFSVTGKRLTYRRLTKPAMERSKQVADEVKRAIREILYSHWIEGKD